MHWTTSAPIGTTGHLFSPKICEDELQTQPDKLNDKENEAVFENLGHKRKSRAEDKRVFLYYKPTVDYKNRILIKKCKNFSEGIKKHAVD